MEVLQDTHKSQVTKHINIFLQLWLRRFSRPSSNKQTELLTCLTCEKVKGALSKRVVEEREHAAAQCDFHMVTIQI